MLLNPYRFLSAVADPNFANVSLLLHGDGANGSTSFIDSSSSPSTVGFLGNVNISTAQSKFGGSSILFDGAGDYLTIPTSTKFDFGTSNFAVEAWVFPTILSGLSTFVGRQEPSTAMAFQLRRNTSTLELVLRGSGGVGLSTLSGGTLLLNQWQHVACDRRDGTVRLFLNGTQTASAASVQNLTCTRPLTVGVTDDTSLAAYFTGYIDDVRVTKGESIYGSSFTPPTAAFPNA